MRELLRDPVHHAADEADLVNTVHSQARWRTAFLTVQRNHQAVTGRFASASLPDVAVFNRVAETLRDECTFVSHTEYACVCCLSRETCAAPRGPCMHSPTTPPCTHGWLTRQVADRGQHGGPRGVPDTDGAASLAG